MGRSRTSLGALGIAFGLLVVGIVRAEIPGQSAASLKENSTLIVTATVRQVYSAEKPGDGVLEKVHLFVTEAVVDAVEKGAGPAAGKVIYIHTHRNQFKPGAVGGSGHWGNIEAGKKLRFYLKEGVDGTFEALLPNGIEKLDK